MFFDDVRMLPNVTIVPFEDVGDEQNHVYIKLLLFVNIVKYEGLYLNV